MSFYQEETISFLQGSETAYFCPSGNKLFQIPSGNKLFQIPSGKKSVYPIHGRRSRTLMINYHREKISGGGVKIHFFPFSVFRKVFLPLYATCHCRATVATELGMFSLARHVNIPQRPLKSRRKWQREDLNLMLEDLGVQMCLIPISQHARLCVVYSNT